MWRLLGPEKEVVSEEELTGLELGGPIIVEGGYPER